ncbi:hypothetical protein BGM26_15820 [Bacillus sp. FJAT-29790]|uniref:hypothetical protein n=1 Tax=Bacillus sp. FJAT-29790 TaxID=1895002 RepID=UPI001C243720|nr:hypothetical protein [Bacillus sp. FJAT-29790]MBU8880421.1 hypothetical protein [Bacillus sp. FJAT-29790]
MKKKIMAFTGTVALASMLMASGAQAVESPKETTVSAVQSVNYNGTDQATERLKQQISLLEQAVAPVSAKDAAAKWAKALSDRNGAYQFALFTEAYKKTTLPYFEYEGWVTGGSSPWVNDLKIKEEKKVNQSTYTFKIEFKLQSSTGSYGKESATITVKQVNKNWYIDKADLKADSALIIRTPYENNMTIYKAAEYSFSIPASWTKKYNVTEKNGNLVFKYKPKNTSISERTLFSIDKIKETVWEKDGYSEGLYKQLGVKDGYVYAMLPASENQYADRPNSVEYREFHDMSLQFNMIPATFKFENNKTK